MARRWAFLDHPGPLAFAHRGGAGEWPENTMRAFEHAVSLGYRYLETDVHTTSDGVLVAFHDDVLDRLTDLTGRIRDRRWADVRRARVDGEGIPLLEDVLGTWPHVRINIDPKHDSAVLPLVDVLTRTESFDRVCVGAFSTRRLWRFRRLTGHRVCTAMAPSEIARLRLASLGMSTWRFVAGCAQVPIEAHGHVVMDRRLVTTAHRLGLQVHVWTIDDRDEMERLLDLGVDGIMSDRPAVLKDVLMRRGQWA